MERSLKSQLAHVHHPIAAPLDDSAVRRVLDRAVVRDGARLLDLGCGQAEWLIRALEANPGATAVGVDIAANALEEARAQAVARGVGDRLELHVGDAANATLDGAFDVVLSVGATHAFGGVLGTLAAARKHLAPGGAVVVGDAYWLTEPTAEAVEMLGEYEDLATTVENIVADGWVPVYGHLSTRHELDDYEWHWTGSLAEWAVNNPEHPDAAEALESSAAHRTEWLRVYRDSFGFHTLVLRSTKG
ncbi:SAM-dependent methyltransferase [Streptomyces spiroverticillatus]|uniref:SAM-dependent methyltransferase n=1 Tax=Streptomyces finlayi TaxID=67296 RepID=A0A919CCI3_9ACTN|nr:class I SAM-dependent methyltransferase [Streptomyces finlayi]GGZ94161.1 SAM-dependent methyltransferase [Streptomyces spiroverticillatus]GHD06599.1 SAM-dependent methyltransferase [Streptomyces finlayi]